MPESTPTHKRRIGSGHARVLLVAVIVGAVVVAVVAAVTGHLSERSPFHETAEGPRAKPAASDFAASKAGDCVTWNGTDTAALRLVPCTNPHKFEVAGDLPRAFGAKDPYPTDAVLSTTRTQQCSPLVASYLDKRLDPMGRFQVGLLGPNAAAWAGGERTMRCGVEMVDGTGTPQEMTGKVADQDQSVAWPVGTCVGVSPQGQATAPVDCSEPHAFEVTGDIDMAGQFGGPNASWPTLQTQETYLAKQCPALTNTWFGASDGLRKSSLQLQWTKLAQPSWSAGSRKVICFIGSSSKTTRGFAPLTGSAKSGDLLIAGKKPAGLGPPGRRLPTPVPLPPGMAPNPQTVPAGG
ncbi:septum formation family protein [Tsukamurella sp. 8F]|uniref:septum formation family protein n=1 Tax=unclassified Tsukamurella TaxID=2633480 RepID=UPI0023BA38D1|nr:MULTISPECIES: septum formation family protein [unclassified Tsukamurella]MDF0530810.1 septum formation family protein [Tsukamurella sp. 8J]MDF0588336.1 septum formation family protein [Tsukamurella sp. 8F]